VSTIIVGAIIDSASLTERAKDSDTPSEGVNDSITTTERVNTAAAPTEEVDYLLPLLKRSIILLLYSY
jgi:hypothetical protein